MYNGSAGSLIDQYKYCFMKLSAFKMRKYDKVLLLDSDLMVLQNLDHLFAMPVTTIAMPNAYWLSATGGTALMVLINTSQDLWSTRIQKYLTDSNLDYGTEMNLLNEEFKDDLMLLPKLYGLIDCQTISDEESIKHFGLPVAQVMQQAPVVHFSCTGKPWNDYTNDVNINATVEHEYYRELWRFNARALCYPNSEFDSLLTMTSEKSCPDVWKYKPLERPGDPWLNSNDVIDKHVPINASKDSVCACGYLASRAMYNKNQGNPCCVPDKRFALANKRLLPCTDGVYVEIGANVGNDASLFHRRCLEYKSMYLYEPIPAAVHTLRENFANVSKAKITHAAVTKVTGTLELPYSNDLSEGTSAYATVETTIAVPSLRAFDAIHGIMQLEGGRIGIMQMNCEGCEFDVLEDLIDTGTIAHIETLLIATHRMPNIADPVKRYCRLRQSLAKTHRFVWGDVWIFERWDLK